MAETQLYSLEVDVAAIEKLVKNGKQAVSLAFRYIAEEVWGNLRREAPVDQGQLAGSFQLSKLSEMSYRIFTRVKYALDVNNGTAPHFVPFEEIAPWAIRHGIPPGAVWRSIQQVGTRPNPFAERAVAETQTRVNEFMDRAVREVQSG